MTTIDEELEQPLNGAPRRLTLFNGTYLRVRGGHTGDRPAEYWLNLAFLDPTPVRHTEPLWAILATLFGLSAVGSFAVAQSAIAAATHTPWTLVGWLMLLATFASVGFGLRRRFRRLIFLTRHGRVPVLWIASRSPDRQSVRWFLDRLRSAVQRALAEHSPVRGDYLRDEMKEHRRLQEQGVLDPKQFESARALILRAHD